MNKDGIKSNKKIATFSFILIIILSIGMALTLYVNTQFALDKKKEKIFADLENIYNYSLDFKKSIGENQRKEDIIYHDKIKRNLDLEVYNQNIINKYSALMQDGNLIVYYGAGENLIQYPTEEMFASSEKPANKEDYENYQFYTYLVSSNKVIVTGFSEAGLKFIQGNETLVIPSEFQGKPVKEISDMAFYNKKISGNIVIPESIEKVGRDSFSMNGKRGKSNSIGKPYEGTWVIERDKWVKAE